MVEESEEEVFLYSGQDPSEIPDNITHVKCDESVTEIPAFLFTDCDHLITVELNEGLQRIVLRSFWNCTSLRSINFPSTLEVIGDGSLQKCETLITVELNKGLKVIGEFAFSDCTSLRNIKFPSTLQVIGDQAFYKCNGIVTAELNEGLTKVGEDAFSGCTLLTSINFPSTLEEIGEDSFSGCKNLVTAEFNEGLRVIGGYTFNQCASLRNINFPSTLEVIGNGAFQHCTQLVTVVLNEGLKSIGQEAFLGCTLLRNINFPSTLEKIENFAFGNCDSLVTAELNEGLKAIGGYAFHVCESLQNITFPSTLEVIGDGTCYYCTDLIAAKLNEGLKVIGHVAFSRCTSLRSINFPSTLEKIEEKAFSDCESLVTVELNEGLISIGPYAFNLCTSLGNINLPSTLEEIGNHAFVNCTSLVSVELSKGLLGIIIEEGAFADCDRLRNIYIPSTTVTNKVGKIFTKYCLLAEQFPNDDDEDFTQLINWLKDRFNGLPIHELCYFQSHHPTATTLEQLQQQVVMMESNPDRNLEGSVNDLVGMTPFHILALSTKPNIDLIKVLLEIYPTNYDSKKDAWGYRPIDYLIERESPKSDSFAKEWIQSFLANRIKGLGLESWKDDVLVEAENFPEGLDGVKSRKDRLGLIYSTLAKYEMLEALSLLEMFLWSMKIKEANTIGGIQRECPEQEIDNNNVIGDREGFRINCGADIVISNVLPYLS